MGLNSVELQPGKFQPINVWYLELEVSVQFINCLNAWAIIAPFSESKGCGVVLSFYRKLIKR